MEFYIFIIKTISECYYWYTVEVNPNNTGRSLPKSYHIPVCLMVFKTTFNNFKIIARRSILLVEESRIPGEKQPVTSH